MLLESKYIPEEIWAYQHCFELLGAEVHLISRLNFGDYRPEAAMFYGDVDPLDTNPFGVAPSIQVTRDLSSADPEAYDAVIMSANYTSVRLRYSAESLVDLRAFVQSAPAVKWFSKAMGLPKVVKGALCHGLWVLTPHPELLKGRRVVCNPVMLADVLNCGADVVLNPKVVVDGDLVTGYSKHEVVDFIEAIAGQMLAEGVTHAS